MAGEMHKEGVYAPYNFNPRKLANHIASYVDDSSRCGFIYEKNGTVAGAMLGYMDRHYFGDSIIGCENGLFISKEHRGGMAVVKLIKSFESWAKSNGAESLCLSTSNNGKDDRWLKFCDALGYQHVGYVFHKGV